MITSNTSKIWFEIVCNGLTSQMENKIHSLWWPLYQLHERYIQQKHTNNNLWGKDKKLHNVESSLWAMKKDLFAVFPAFATALVSWWFFNNRYLIYDECNWKIVGFPLKYFHLFIHYLKMRVSWVFLLLLLLSYFMNHYMCSKRTV